MKYALPLLVTLVLSGCAISHRATLPDGSQGYVISHCKDLSYCYNKAASLCGGKYTILTQSSGSQGAAARGFGALETLDEITVKCP